MCFCHFSFTHRLKRLLLQLLRLSTLLMRNGWYVICYSLIVYLHLTSRTRNQRKKRRKQQQTVLLLSQLPIRLLTVAQLLLILVSALFKLLVALSVTFCHLPIHASSLHLFSLSLYLSSGEPITAAVSIQPQPPVAAATKDMSEMKIEVTPSSPTRLMLEAESPSGSPHMERRSPSPNALAVQCTIPKAKSLVRIGMKM